MGNKDSKTHPADEEVSIFSISQICQKDQLTKKFNLLDKITYDLKIQKFNYYKKNNFQPHQYDHNYGYEHYDQHRDYDTNVSITLFLVKLEKKNKN